MRAIALSVLASFAVACGSKLDTPAENRPADTGATIVDSAVAETAVIDAAADTAVLPTESTTCKRLVAAMCSKPTENCCTELGIPFLAGACAEAVMAYCSTRIDAVTLGRATYDESQLEACAASYESPKIGCSAEFIPTLRASVACAHLFNGTKEPGAACANSVECHAPEGAIAYCDQTAKRCRASFVVAEGAACNFTGSNLRYCDDGFYCDLTGASAACRKELAAGADCAAANYIACGYSSTCVDGKCGAGLAEGAACTEASQCSSWTCREGKCTSTLYPRVDKGLCNAGTSG